MIIRLLFISLLIILSTTAEAKMPAKDSYGARGGLGMDISGGIAYGLGGNYHLYKEDYVAELGLHLYGGSSSKASVSGAHTYTDKTSILVFGFLANFLFNYNNDASAPFWIAGVGLTGVAVNWSEESATDTSLGTPLTGGGSIQRVNSGGFGSIVNLGVGYLFGDGLDLRFEAPMIFIFSPGGGASSFVPTFTLTAGYRL